MKRRKEVVTIIGAGVIGLAVARQLSETYDNIFVVEKNMRFGEEISGRNSEVIHSGIYYPANSLKAKLCLLGNKMLYDYCIKKNIKYNQCGKLIVSQNRAENVILSKIFDQGIKNNVEGLKLLDRSNTRKIEPNINCSGALLVPSTGVFDSASYMKQLESDSKNNGVEFVYGSKVVKIMRRDSRYCLTVQDGAGEEFEFDSEIVINAAGLYADKVSSLVGLSRKEYEIFFCKGEYFSVINGKNNYINKLIYPVPDQNLKGLGIHVTIDINHGMKLGPNAEYLKGNKIDYSVKEENKELFFKEAKKYLPFLEKEDMIVGEAGIRPKLNAKGEPQRDFVIVNEVKNGYPNFINLIGIESPGLTSSLSIAKYVNEILI